MKRKKGLENHLKVDYPIKSEHRKFPRIQFLRLPEVLGAVGIGKSKLYQLIGQGTFPPPKKIGEVAIWTEEEVTQWQEKLLRKQEVSSLI